MKLKLRNRPLNEVRKDLMVPGVIFGKSIESTSVEVDDKALKDALKAYGKSRTFQVTLSGKKHNVYIKNVQTKVLKPNDIIHFDLHRIADDETITAVIPLVFEGKEQLDKDRKFVQTYLPGIECEYYAGQGLDNFTFDVSEAEIGFTVYIKDLEVSDKLKIHHDPDQMVFQVKEQVAAPEEVLETEEVEDEMEPELVSDEPKESEEA
ncbi:MAG: 50S ribosomal protein L25 [Acholeplasmataceae bacterium]